MDNNKWESLPGTVTVSMIVVDPIMVTVLAGYVIVEVIVDPGKVVVPPGNVMVLAG
jgi:hypothetical protein